MAMRSVAVILTLVFGAGCADRSYEVSDCDKYPSAYRESVKGLLAQKVQGEVVGTAFVFPSFGEEWAVFLVKTATANDVYRVQFDKSFWGAGNYEQGEKGYGTWSRDRAVERVSVQASNVDVGPETLDQIRVVFGQVANSHRRTATGGVDGTSYYIYAQDGSCAAIWSPSQNLRSAYVVSFIETLGSYARANDHSWTRVQDMLWALGNEK